ncbi:triose-phosphate isomerase [Candidatus Nanohaloarchaea archaeon]|nr:triose-phosphate isomerase [Candidatus Nanohaloarchaea archaeon]
MIIINTKAYRKGVGKDLEQLVKTCTEMVDPENLIFSVQPEDLLRLEETDVEVFAQHLDPVEPGSHTGSILGEGIVEAGASGTLLNHSENRLESEQIKASVEKAKELGLNTVVCAQSPEECREFKEFEPDYIAFEPPELIGGDTSVAEAEPEIIEEAVEASAPVPALTGAGIKTAEDVSKSLEHGCEGVLVASGVVKAEKPGEAVEELVKGL